MKKVIKRFVFPLSALLLLLAGGCVSRLFSGDGQTLMSFNVRHCRGMDGKLDIPRTAKAIAKWNPRFVALQEVDVKVKRSQNTDQAAELGKLTGMFHSFGPAINLQGGKYGVAVLSKDKPLSVRNIPLPGLEPRTFLLVEFEDCFFGATHFDYRSESNRVESVKIIRKAIDGLSGGKTVFVCGDLNARNDSATLVELRKGFRVLSDVSKGTFHDSETKNCIDYIAVDAEHSDEWEVLYRETVQDEETSDHKPIVAKIAKKKNGR